MVLLVFPAIITLSLPSAFLLGLILALGRLTVSSVASSTKQWLSPVFGLSIATALFTFVLCGWVSPETNQSHRERAFRWVIAQQFGNAKGFVPRGSVPRSPADRDVVSLPKGSRELTLGELQTLIRERRAQGQSTVELVVEWHKKWAIPAACLLYGPLGLGLHGSRRHPRPAVNFAIAFAATVVFYLALRIGEQSALGGHLGPLPAIWAGDVILALLTLWVIARSLRLREAIRELRPDGVA